MIVLFGLFLLELPERLLLLLLLLLLWMSKHFHQHEKRSHATTTRLSILGHRIELSLFFFLSLFFLELAVELYKRANVPAEETGNRVIGVCACANAARAFACICARVYDAYKHKHTSTTSTQTHKHTKTRTRARTSWVEPAALICPFLAHVTRLFLKCGSFFDHWLRTKNQ